MKDVSIKVGIERVFMKLRKGRGIAIVLFLLGILLIGLSITYTIMIAPMDKSSKKKIEVLVPKGQSVLNMGKVLEQKGLIRNAFFFKVYVKLNGIHDMKADIYYMNKSMSMKEITDMLRKGSNQNENAIRLTFHEGKTITQYAETLEKNTDIKAEDFLAKMKDTTYIQGLIENYWFLTDAILNPDIYYPLEGYLAPDTYEFKGKDVTIEEVVKTLLDQEEKVLEPYKETLEAQGNVHEVLTLASIAQLEAKNAEDQKLIVGVFQNRLALGMNLGSDVTTYYAFQEEMDKDLTTEMFNTYNPYNTRSQEMAGRLPVGPICNMEVSALEAGITPTASEYYYFVADKNGKIYYTKTNEEHEQTVQEIKDRGDWIW